MTRRWEGTTVNVGEEPLREPAGKVLRLAFDQRLVRLDDLFVGAALVVLGAMPRLTEAFLSGDASSVQDAQDMAADVSDRIRQLEDDGFLLLAREAPVGRDLRRLVAVLRLTHDIDRSGHLLRHVAESVEHVDARTLPEEIRTQIRELSERSADVFRAGIDAWRNRDGDAVFAVDGLDREIDALQSALLASAAEHEANVGTGMLILGLIGRYFERIADHGVAIARDVAFVVTGARVDTESS